MKSSKIRHRVISFFLFCFLFVVSQTMVATISSAITEENPLFTRTGSFVDESADLRTMWINETNYTNWQRIVDHPDYALLMADYYNVPIIADHSTQNFHQLYDVQCDDIATMTMDDDVQVNYTCTATFEGINTGVNLTTLEGVPILYEYDADLILYTCMRSKSNPNGIFITLWDRNEEMTEIVDDEVWAE